MAERQGMTSTTNSPGPEGYTAERQGTCETLQDKVTTGRQVLLGKATGTTSGGIVEANGHKHRVDFRGWSFLDWGNI